MRFIQDPVTERMAQKVAEAGFQNKPVTGADQFGPGEFRSYFEYLVERKLSGEEQLEPKPQELFEAMKRQLSYHQIQLVKAGEEYMRLQNKLRDAQQLIDDLQKGR